MKLVCPRCQAKIMPSSVNISTDLAKCDNCQEILKASALAQAAEAVEDLAPPAGTRIRIEGRLDSEVTFHLPRAGFSPAHLFPLIFMLCWLGFIGFWTWGASRGSSFFALFSVPFWLMGLSMLGGVVNRPFERQTLRLGSGMLRIRKSRPFFPRNLEIALEEVSQVALEQPVFRNSSAISSRRRFDAGVAPAGAPEVLITHGRHQTRVGGMLSMPEREWLARVLGVSIGHATGRPVSG